MAELAIIGGTGLTSLKDFNISHREVVNTPFGTPSAPLIFGKLGEKEVCFLPRHGSGHTIPPHMINYRANMWALNYIGIKRVIAVAAVGGIQKDLSPMTLVTPNQIIDYTWSRAHTFFEDRLSGVVHIDFTEPYCPQIRAALIQGGKKAGIRLVEGGTYGAMQGPRLESAAEINRMEKDGCDMVGMTGMPEAVLARELELRYATCGVVANWAAGRGTEKIEMSALKQNLNESIEKVRKLLEPAIRLL